MDLEFTGEMWFWRGPSPYHFVTVPDAESAELEAVSAEVSYGWGVIPVAAQVGDTRWTTSLFPKNGQYIVPFKDAVRRAEDLRVGDMVTVRLAVGPGAAGGARPGRRVDGWTNGTGRSPNRS